jgi:hypothetical protein
MVLDSEVNSDAEKYLGRMALIDALGDFIGSSRSYLAGDSDR